MSASFRGAVLVDARLTGADCDGVGFEDADLTSFSFRNAYLAQARFKNANLVDANLTRACLTGATFTGAGNTLEARLGRETAGALILGSRGLPLGSLKDIAQVKSGQQPAQDPRFETALLGKYTVPRDLASEIITIQPSLRKIAHSRAPQTVGPLLVASRCE